MSQPKNGKSSMSTVAAVAERLVTREETRTRSRMLAYQAVASKVGRSADWLRKFIRDGSGVVTDDLKRRMDELLVRGLEADLARLQAELDVARQVGAHPLSARIGEVERRLAETKALLNLEA